MKIIAFLAVIMMLFSPMAAHATVDNVAASPAQVSVPFKGAKTLNIRWIVTRTGPAGGGPFTVSSPNALLQVGGSTIATLAGNLSQVSNLGAGVTGTLIFNETVTISPALARRIAEGSAGTVRVVRTFDDTIAPSTGFVSIATGASTSGPLSVRRIELSFENQSRTDVVQKGDTLRAVADVSFRSNGLLRGEWRLVNPSSSLGEARGRVLNVVRQQLVSSGEGRTRIVSPPLPTDTNGLHLLSFSVEDTDGNIEIPILRYFVLEGRDNVPPTNMTALTPGNGASVNQDTIFSWGVLESADAYQLEILMPGSDVPATAKLVPGTDLKLSLSSLSFEDLSPRQNYDWRVRAFANGKVIGQSQRQSIQIQ
ncbi:MAG: hypothetical protein AAF569_05210 [Pseudomonadota bacterium]